MVRKSINVGEKNGSWKGDDVGYDALHAWVKRRLPHPPNCERCGKKVKKLDLANVSGKYLRRLDDWEYLCRSCHMNGDGRKDNLLKGFSGRPLKSCQVCSRLTTGVKYCEVCRKEVRRLWWKQYNQTLKRQLYYKNRYKCA